jgi:hypothetical protein
MPSWSAVSKPQLLATAATRTRPLTWRPRRRPRRRQPGVAIAHLDPHALGTDLEGERELGRRVADGVGEQLRHDD